MAAAYKAILADRRDLESITVNCRKCWTGVSVPLEGAKAVTYCPSCETPYEDDVKSAILALMRFVQHARAVERGHDKKPIFQFEIKIKADPPADQ